MIPSTNNQKAFKSRKPRVKLLVLCSNDFPYAAFEDVGEAELERTRLEVEDIQRRQREGGGRRVYYKIQTIPLYKKKRRK